MKCKKIIQMRIHSISKQNYTNRRFLLPVKSTTMINLNNIFNMIEILTDFHYWGANIKRN